MNKLLQVLCPQCDGRFFYYESEFRPFCCERCKMIDLGHWFEESYRLPTKEKIEPEPNNENKQNENQNEERDSDQYEEGYPGEYEDDENNY